MSGDANKACSSKQAPGRMKPPHSYIALIATAILSSPEKRLTLTEINEHLVNNYSFFRGSYQGWRNSVRHNLSFNKCFVKILRDPARPWGKDNYWTVCSLTDYLLSDGTFRRRRRRKPKKKAEAKDAEQMQHGALERSSNEHETKLLKTSVHPNRSGSSGADTAHCSRVESRPERTPFKGSFSIDRILSDENWNEKKPELSLQPSASHLDIPGKHSAEHKQSDIKSNNDFWV